MAAKVLSRLSAREVQVAANGVHNDGGGLALVIVEGRAAWRFRYTAPSGLRRDAGLGNAVRDSMANAGASLRNARIAAERMRSMVREGKDPLDERDRNRATAKADVEAVKAASKREALTLRRFVRAYHVENVEKIRHRKTSIAWINSIEQNLPVKLMDTPVADVLAVDLLDALVAVSRRIPETGSRVYTRLAAVFDAAVVERIRPDNPVRPIAGELRRRAPAPPTRNFPALQPEDMPRFVQALREAPGVAPRALEVLILCAARTAEVLGMKWSEVDSAACTWTILSARMKTGRRAHVVHLTVHALNLIEAQRGQDPVFVFPSPVGTGRPLSGMAFEMTMRRLHAADLKAGGPGYMDKEQGRPAVPHGMRSSFSSWANEIGHRRDAIEAALSHIEQNKIRRAYNRSSYAAERRVLLTDWAAHCDGKAPTSNVVEFKARAA